MQRIGFSIDIQAPKEKVWRTLLDDASYRQWTSAFAEGSYAVTDWQEGSEAKFLGPNGDGMYSRIAAHRPNEFLSIEHLGMLKNGEVVQDDAAASWSGALENYTVRESDGVSTLTIKMDTTDPYVKYFEETWPKALQKVKDLAETERSAA